MLGRGYSKTVVVCVLSEIARQQDREELQQALVEHVARVNLDVEKHARIGAIIVTHEPWTIENEVLTPTLKIRRDEVESRFGDRARELAREAAEKREIRVEWPAPAN